MLFGCIYKGTFIMTSPSTSIVIIGTGLAGYSLAKEYRKIDTTSPLVLITQDDGHFYSKPLLSTATHQAKTPDCLVVTSADDMQKQLAATLYTYTTVTHMDTAAKTLLLQSIEGKTQEITYSKLIFANGAIPRPIPLLDNMPNHYRVNSLCDYRHFMKACANWQQLTILGSGLVGCEFAHDLTKTAMNMQIYTLDPHPLYGMVPAPVGNALQAVLSNLGVTWHTNTTITKEIALSSQGILSAIGLLPNIALAQSAQLVVNQGIVVDAYLQTSDPHIYALGDCAEIEGICRQYVAPILQCARTLAQTLTGKPTPVSLTPMPVTLKVSACPIIAFTPPKHIAGEWHYAIQDHNVKALYYDEENTLQGYALSGSYIQERQTCQLALGKIKAIV